MANSSDFKRFLDSTIKQYLENRKPLSPEKEQLNELFVREMETTVLCGDCVYVVE